jgi:hypothetical protein
MRSVRYRHHIHLLHPSQHFDSCSWRNAPSSAASPVADGLNVSASQRQRQPARYRQKVDHGSGTS